MHTRAVSYILYCREAGFDCNTIVAGESAEEILAKVRLHASDDHGVDVTPAIADQVRTLIKSA